MLGVWVVVPATIVAFIDDPSTTATTEGTNKAIAREKARRAEASEEFATRRSSIVSEINELLKSQDYHAASKRAGRYSFIDDSEIEELHRRALKGAKEAGLLRSIESTPADDIVQRAKLFGELTRLAPANSAYAASYARYSQEVETRNQRVAAEMAEVAQRVAKEQAAREKKQAAEKKQRNARVARFGAAPEQSSWDGSYFAVERYLKHVANDPESIDIDGCTGVYHTEEGWLVGCDYRGRNGFGALIRQSNWFTLRHGRVVAMHESTKYKP